jgi:hypothetical protein
MSITESGAQKSIQDHCVHNLPVSRQLHTENTIVNSIGMIPSFMKYIRK